MNKNHPPGYQSVFSPENAANRLAQAWAEGFLIDEFAEDEHPRTEAEGYAVQQELAVLLGEKIGGYKLGLGSSAAMRRTGLGRPVWGFMTAPAMFETGANLPPITTGRVLVETELAFVAKHRITPRNDIADLSSGWEAHAALEFVRSRLVDWNANGLPSFIADSVGFHAFVLGEKLPPDTFLHGALPSASLKRNGVVVASAAEENERADPFAALAHFLKEAFALNLKLEAGTVITTGNLVAPYFADYDSVFEGAIGDFRVGCSVMIENTVHT